MALLKKLVLFTVLIWITVCSSKPYKRDFSNASGNNGGGQVPFAGGSGGVGGFTGGSGGRGGFGGMSNGGGGGGTGNGMGVNPFNAMANGASAGKGGSPFANAAGNGDGNGSGGMGAGPFASGMNNGGGGGSVGGVTGSGNGGGMGAGPFAGGAAGNGNGNGASPFASAMSNGGNSNNNGAGPFASGMSGTGSGPFNANTDNGGMPGGLSSLISSGPGGLAGGDFLPSNVSMLMGHDFSKGVGNDGQFGGTGLTAGENNGVDNSRFDTSAYQQMLQQLFSTDNSGQGVKDMGNPFDGSSYNYNSNTGDHYNTAMEASVGSFASTDMSAYSGNSGGATEQTNSQYQSIQKGNSGQYQSSGSSSYSGGSNMASSGTSTGSDATYSNPFDVNNYDMGRPSSNSGGSVGMGPGSGMSNGQSPFKINNYNAGKNPFSINNNGAGSSSGNGVGTGSGPFDASKFGMMSGNSDKQSGMGQNPFDTSGYQASGALSNMLGNQQYQNTGTGSVNYNSGLDEYGNVNFGTLSGLSGNQVDAGAAGGLGASSYSSGTNSYSAKPQGSSTYSGFQEGSGTGQYGVHNGVDYRGSGSTYNGVGSGYNAGSESQYETPFEADNYNDLLGNPFKSDSYFDTTRQNFKLPYETNSDLQQTSYGSSETSAGQGGSMYGAGGGGPGGDPFHQGGNSMRATNAMRGRRSIYGIQVY